MKIVHVSTSDRQGGAAIAAYRLNEAMRMAGIDSKMLVACKISDNNSVLSLSELKGKQYKFIYELVFSLIFHIKKYLFKPFGVFSLASFFSYSISRLSLLREADVIYIHWTNNSFLSIREISRIMDLGKPVIFFMHDMWLITGGCHHAFSCDGFQNSCMKCPNIGRTSINFIAKYTLHKKKKIAQYNNVYLMSPSNWMNGCVERSILFKNKKRVVVPNTLSISRFSSVNMNVARRILGLPMDKKLILFAADGGTDNPYKGWSYLKDSLKKITDVDLGLVVLGNHLSREECLTIHFPVYSLGRVFDEYSLALLYSAVDVYVTSSLVEAFGQTIVEAQACGTLVVGFNIGGIPDIINHKVTGYLVHPRDIDDLKTGILWALDNCDNEEVKRKLQDSAQSKYSYETVIKMHIDFWSRITSLDNLR